MIISGRVRIKGREYTVVWDSICVTPTGRRCLYEDELPDDMIKQLTIWKMRREDPSLVIEVLESTMCSGVKPDFSKCKLLPPEEVARRQSEDFARWDKIFSNSN